MKRSRNRQSPQREKAVAYIAEFNARTGEWPLIKSIERYAGVGRGTAWRALDRFRPSRSNRGGHA